MDLATVILNDGMFRRIRKEEEETEIDTVSSE